MSMHSPLAAPLEPYTCNNSDCTLPDGGSCARAAEFDEPLLHCLDLARRAKQAQANPVSEEAVTGLDASELHFSDSQTSNEVHSSGLEAPWQGRGLSTQDVNQLLRRSKAKVIAIAGVEDSGKTTFILSTLLQLANDQRDGLPYRFASSLSLAELQALMNQFSDWQGGKTKRTVNRTHRPGEDDIGRYIHFGLRPIDISDNRHIDVLMSDIPGEVFSNFRRNANQPQVKAFLRRCDALCMFLDASFIFESPRRADRLASRQLKGLITAAKREHGHDRNRPLCIIFSKFDKVIDHCLPPTPSNSIEAEPWKPLSEHAPGLFQALKRCGDSGFDVKLFPVSAAPSKDQYLQPVGVMEPLKFILAQNERTKVIRRSPTPVTNDSHPFHAMRPWRDSP